MGREATVQCRWADESGLCNVLLETHELVVRGALRRRVAVADLLEVSVKGDELNFRVGQDAVSFSLGPALAQRWAKAIATPPPTLASKLGISAASRLRVIGEIESEELKAAIAEADTSKSKEADLVVVSVGSAIDLELALNQIPNGPSGSTPLWIVYPKGRHAKHFGETSVRETLRRRGFIDTKVASVSSDWTALRFIWRDH